MVTITDAFAFQMNIITIKVNIGARLLHIINSQKNFTVDRIVKELDRFYSPNYSHDINTEKVFYIPESYSLIKFFEACVCEIKEENPLMTINIEIYEYDYKANEFKIGRYSISEIQMLKQKLVEATKSFILNENTTS